MTDKRMSNEKFDFHFPKDFYDFIPHLESRRDPGKYNCLLAEAKRAREAERTLQEELDFLDKSYKDEIDDGMTLDAVILKYKLQAKQAREAEKRLEDELIEQLERDSGVIAKLRAENAKLKAEIAKCKQSAYYGRQLNEVRLIKKLFNDYKFWVTIAVIFLAIGLLLLVKEAQSEEPIFIPVSRTAYTIKPYFEWKPIIDAHINLPVKSESCPIQDGDYQCPMPKDADDAIPRQR